MTLYSPSGGRMTHGLFNKLLFLLKLKIPNPYQRKVPSPSGAKNSRLIPLTFSIVSRRAYAQRHLFKCIARTAI